jgi:hypothetical protein
MNEIIINIPYRDKRKTLTKTYEISIVPPRFTVDYPKYMEKQKALIKLGARYDKANTVDELEAIRTEMEGLDLESILKEKYKLIKTIMIANGYDDEWDESFWDTKVSPHDIDEFIARCMLKDYDPAAKKKVESLISL